jgi:hypothetical protein
MKKDQRIEILMPIDRVTFFFGPAFWQAYGR